MMRPIRATAGVVLWNLFLLTVSVGRRPVSRRVVVAEWAPASDALKRWRRQQRPAALHAMGVAIGATVTVIGFRIGLGAVTMVVCVGLHVLASALATMRMLVFEGARPLGWLVTRKDEAVVPV